MDKVIIFYKNIEGKEERISKLESELDEQEKNLLYGELVMKLHSSPICIQERFINELLKEINTDKVLNEEQPTPETKRSKRKK